MLKIVDVVYHCHHEYDQPQGVLEKHSRSLGFVEHIKDRVNYEVITHLNYEGKEIIDNVSYSFFKRSNKPWQIPFKTHKYIKSVKPDVVLVHGFVFPLQVIALKFAVGKNCRIILHHHADKPAASIRRIFQRLADHCIDAYMFTAIGLAQPWIDHKIIHDRNKAVEVLGASTYIKKRNKLFCKNQLGIAGTHNFLWVGRLNSNKDPLTVLKGFHKHVLKYTDARLYMIYQTDELLEEIRQEISRHDILQTNVYMIGKKDEATLADWYSATDFFISGSHSEGSGYALVEAMHCGCIPVVTDIPSFNKLTADGKYGLLYEPGNVDELAAVLDRLQTVDINTISQQVYQHAQNKLGFKNIADELFNLCTALTFVKQ